MPSMFKKVLHPHPGGKPNPYSNPQHPNNPDYINPVPSKPPAPPEAPPQLRPASPRESHDYLAEARQAIGRDPVTGRQVRDHSRASQRGESGGDGDPTSNPILPYPPYPAAPTDAAGSSTTNNATQENSAYADRSRGMSNTRGTKYDLFVQQMKDRKKGGWREPEGGFYAPERRVGEYYAPPEFYSPAPATRAASGRGSGVAPGAEGERGRSWFKKR